MKLATTSFDFAGYCRSYCECIKHVQEAGFKYIDLSLDYIEIFEENLLSDDWEKGAKKIKEFAENLGVEFVQAHAVSGSNMYFPGVDKDLVYKKTVRSIEVCGKLGIKNMVLHSQISRQISLNKESHFEANRNHLKTLFPLLEETGVNVLIENGPKRHSLETYYTDEKIENPRYLCAFTNATIMREFLDYVNHPLVHACWDTGHANLDSTQYEQLMILGDELYGIHVHDNWGESDEHVLPYFGTMSLDDLMHGLIDCGYSGCFTFEAVNSLGTENYYMPPRRKFDGDERLYTPPIELKKHMERFMYMAGEHILKSYGCFEE